MNTHVFTKILHILPLKISIGLSPRKSKRLVLIYSCICFSTTCDCSLRFRIPSRNVFVSVMGYVSSILGVRNGMVLVHVLLDSRLMNPFLFNRIGMIMSLV